MFFAIELLTPQHHGRFHLCWLAATRGVRFIRTKQIVECNIPELCSEILKMVMSNATRPRLRFSLSLSSRLINGTIKIYKKQVEILLSDTVEFFVARSRFDVTGNGIMISLDSETTLTPEIITKRKRRNQITLPTPPEIAEESAIRPVEEGRAEPAPVETITFTEDPPRFQHTEKGNVFSLGTIVEDIEHPQLLQDSLAPSTIQAIPLTPKRRRISLDKSPPRKRVITEKTFEEVMVQATEMEPAVVQPVVVEPQLITEEQIQKVPQSAPSEESVPVLARRIKSSRVQNKDLINLKKGFSVRIDNAKPFFAPFFNAKEYFPKKREIQLLIPRRRPVDVPSFTTRILREAPDDEDYLVDIVRRNRTDSLSKQKSSLNLDGRQTTSLTDSKLVSSAIMESIPIPSQTERISVAEQLAVEIQDVGEHLLPPTISQSGTMREPATELTPKTQPQTEHRFDFLQLDESTRNKEQKKRLKAMRAFIKNWDGVNPEKLTIENFCPEPINRLNIAVTFNNLLTLSKIGYVRLNNKSDSLELDSISKGRKFDRTN